jgi:hypothetical protein
MDFDAQTFFVDLMDVFSILLPGGLLNYVADGRGAPSSCWGSVCRARRLGSLGASMCVSYLRPPGPLLRSWAGRDLQLAPRRGRSIARSRILPSEASRDVGAKLSAATLTSFFISTRESRERRGHDETPKQ